MLTDGLEWCGLLWCFYQLFGLSFWRHPFTAEHPLLRQWCNATFLQIWWRNKHLHLGWPKDIFQQIKFFVWTIPLSNCFVSGYYYDIMCEVNSLCFSRCNQFTKQTWETVLKGYRPQLLTHKPQKRSTNVKRWVLNITTQQITNNNDIFLFFQSANSYTIIWNHWIFSYCNACWELTKP